MKRFFPPLPFQNLPGFDLDITEIALIHRCEYKPEIYDTHYQNGRMYSGFVYCIDGSCRYVCDDDRFSVSKGCLLFLPPQARYTVLTGAESFLHYTLNFTVNPNSARNGPFYSVLTGNRIIKLLPENPARYEAALSELLTVWNGKHDGFKLVAKARLYLMFDDFFREYQTAQINPRDYHRVCGAKQYIDEHFSEPIAIDYLAALSDLSQTHFRRLFGEVFRTSPTEYQIRLRILKAKDMLKAKQYSVGEIADSCGFSDANYFSRLFKSRVGVSPLRYKQTH